MGGQKQNPVPLSDRVQEIFLIVKDSVVVQIFTVESQHIRNLKDELAKMKEHLSHQIFRISLSHASKALRDIAERQLFPAHGAYENSRSEHFSQELSYP